MEKTERKRVLVLVKTYPNPSAKYTELVCTAGLLEDGSWVRIFPVPFRCYDEYSRYSKYQWIECDLYKAENDTRPESYHLDTSSSGIVLREKVGTDDGWELRRRLILDRTRIFTRKSELVEASSANRTTLAVFKPTSVRLVFNRAKAEPADPKLEAAIRSNLAQRDLFDEAAGRKDFKLAEPLPYEFRYVVTDADGAESRLKIIDWELGALFLRQRQAKDEKRAVEDVVEKYGTRFLDTSKTDLHLYLGTMFRFQKMGVDNPWTIIGVAPFPKVSARPLDLF